MEEIPDNTVALNVTRVAEDSRGWRDRINTGEGNNGKRR
jgi:hypothetical protein